MGIEGALFSFSVFRFPFSVFRSQTAQLAQFQLYFDNVDVSAVLSKKNPYICIAIALNKATEKG